MIRLRQSGVDEILIKRVQDWYDPGPGVFIQSRTALFSPAMLFAGSTTGAWYDPSDITTLFQDAAGTTPVTAVEQPVGRMLDKSGRGNHAFNNSGNSANFPVLSAKYNLLTKTEQFDDAVWNAGGRVGVLTPNQTAAPDGTVTAELFTANTSYGGFSQSVTLPVADYVFTVRLKAFAGIPLPSIDVDLNWGSPTKNGAFSFISDSNLGDGWIERKWSVSLTSSATRNFGFLFTGLTSNVTKFYIWGTDLRVANDALNQPAYQRVNTSSDYDTVGFKQGEVFDGINDYLTASAGGGSTTSFFWCSAIRVGKVGAVQTLFSDAGTNTGYRVRINASNQLELSAGNGASYTTVSTTATLSIGQRSVLTAWHDGINLNVQINNGTVHQVAFSTATAGTAQFTIGKDNNAANNFFAGWLYEKVYTKDNVPSSIQIADTKAYVANIAGITL